MDAAPASPPKPKPDADSLPYWEALRDRRVLVQHCRSCGLNQLYFRAMCKRCWSRDLEHVESSGRGSVYSFTVIRATADPAFSGKVPFVLALVQLEEGPRVVTHIDAVDPDAVAIGDAVQASFVDLDDDATLLHFVPEGAAVS